MTDLGWVSLLNKSTADVVVGTLGPAGTSSEQAAALLRSRLPTKSRTELYQTYEQAHEQLRAGVLTHVVVANAYKEIHRFYMDDSLVLSDVFVMDTPLYGIAKSKDREVLSAMPTIASHPSPRPLVAQLLPSEYRLGEIVSMDSTSSAAKAVAEGAFELALTTEPAAALHGLQFISRKRPIRMVWSVFMRS
jgi:prephenate dehydratase